MGSTKEQQPDEDTVDPCDEKLGVKRWRYRAARKAGLSIAESQMFADSDSSLGHLRLMVKAGRPHDEIVDLLIL